MNLNLRAAVRSHVGRIRTNNEDSVDADPTNGLWVVADGMGGAEGGEIASALAVRTVVDGVKTGTGLIDAISQAHEVIQNAARANPALRGMGSTVVAAEVHLPDFKVAWVGDSRAYLWDGRALSQLSRDHSLVQELLDSGSITLEEAEQHPARHTITQALGNLEQARVRVGSVSGTLLPGQTVLLCSDGLTGEVADKAVSNVLRQFVGLEDKAQSLIDLALENGGSDNITVALISHPKEGSPRPTLPLSLGALESRLRQGYARWRIAACFGAVILLIALYCLGVSRFSREATLEPPPRALFSGQN